MKKFYTAADVDYCASKGETVIYINPGDVVTSVAREEAGKKGIRFEAGGTAAQTVIPQPKADTPSPVPPAVPAYHPAGPAAHAVPQAYPQVKALPYKGLLGEAEIDRWREDFPILKSVAHLGNCSQSAQSKQVLAGIQRYLDNWGSVGMDWDSWMEEIELAKAEFARLIGAEPDEIAIASSVSRNQIGRAHV